MAVATGQADYVVVHKVMTMEAGARYGQAFGQMGQGIPAIGGPFQFSVPYGLQAPGQMFARGAAPHAPLRHDRRAVRARHDARARDGGEQSPKARFRTPITVDDHHTSQMISDPLRLFDFCMETDYGCAVVDHVRRTCAGLPATTGVHRGRGVGAPFRFGNALMSFYNQPDEDFASSGQTRRRPRSCTSTRASASATWTSPWSTTTSPPMVIMSLEDFGFCPKGEGGPYVADGNLGLDGPLPVNPHGGNLAEAYTHGMTPRERGRTPDPRHRDQPGPGATNVLVVGGTGPSPTSGMILTGQR